MYIVFVHLATVLISKCRTCDLCSAPWSRKRLSLVATVHVHYVTVCVVILSSVDEVDDNVNGG